jgi:hypothetical protein
MQRPILPTRPVGWGRAMPRRRAKLGMCLATSALTIVGVSMAQSARADTGDDLRTATAAARGAGCGPLRSDPTIDQAAAAINETTDRWIDNAARSVPETDALPLLKELGYGGTRAAILSGAAENPGDAIKVLLLQGFAKISDCSYTDFGVGSLYNAKKNMILTTVVLAG